ncbi:predicted protein [Naegleria gruberi]|uniref:Predicted protein n=1 Tax=Naegleria gruberi TaxID=5762 RepID=D2VQQ2_NAEGR|nr:uncharacterized protein NAEGRDRAFT_51504 [Naegleria gruberi]EFC40912.1 predicted protein [Naegleria gruberi]|eukprot:XP_002673656.1 predicted protein [Naegleria gruberi strain NEG-M]
MFVGYEYSCILKAFTSNPDSTIVKIQKGLDLYFAVAKDQEIIKELLIRKYKTMAKNEKLLEPLGLFGHNMLTADSTNPIWKKHRVLANPIFSNHAHLKNVFRVTMEELSNMIKYWKDNYDSDAEGNIRNVNTTQELKSITLTVINRVAFGYDIEIFNKSTKHRDEIHQSTTDLLSGIMYKFVFPTWFFEYLPFGIFGKFKKAKNNFRKIAMDMISKKTAEIQKNNEIMEDEDLLSLLMKSSASQNLSDEEKLSDDELVSAMFIIFFAGFETSSTSLNFMLRLLAIHPDVQEKLIEEIDATVESAESMKFEDLTERLPLLNSFIKESFRVKPAVGAVSRTVAKKGGETIGGMHFNEGDQIVFNIMVHHKLSHNNAMDTFKFDRFYQPSDKQDDSSSESSDKGTMGNLTLEFAKDDLASFSLGPRDCLGRRMALIEVKQILVYLLKKYRITVPEHLKEQQAKIKETYIMTRCTFEPFILNFEKRC